jgi:hypothetical protein
LALTPRTNLQNLVINLQFIYNNISTLKETYVLKKVKQNLKEKFQTIRKNKLFNDKRKNIEHKNKLRTIKVFHQKLCLRYKVTAMFSYFVRVGAIFSCLQDFPPILPSNSLTKMIKKL